MNTQAPSSPDGWRPDHSNCLSSQWGRVGKKLKKKRGIGGCGWESLLPEYETISL